MRDTLGTTFVIVSHELASIFAIASNSIFLDAQTRSVTARGNPNELVRDPHTEKRALLFLTRGGERRGEDSARDDAGAATPDKDTSE